MEVLLKLGRSRDEVSAGLQQGNKWSSLEAIDPHGIRRRCDQLEQVYKK